MAEASPLLIGTVSASQLGALLGLSTRRLRELAEAGTIPRAGGRYLLPDAVQRYVEHLREIAAGRATESGGRDLMGERARLAGAQADLAELKLRRERRELVEVEPLRIRLVTMIVAVRNKIMSVPPLAKGRLPHLSVDDIEVLEDSLREALEQLAADPRIFGPDADDADEVDQDCGEETE